MDGPEDEEKHLHLPGPHVQVLAADNISSMERLRNSEGSGIQTQFHMEDAVWAGGKCRNDGPCLDMAGESWQQTLKHVMSFKVLDSVVQMS